MLLPIKRLPRLAVLGLSLAALCALLRWADCYHAIAAERVQFSNVHDLSWDPDNAVLKRTGGDPYVELAVPEPALRNEAVEFVFVGAYVPTEGSFYVAESSPGKDWIFMTPRVHAGSGGIQVRASLHHAHRLRLDLPDFLPRTLRLRRIVIRTPFLRLDRLSFWGGLLSLGVFAGSLWQSARRARAPRGAVEARSACPAELGRGR